MEPARPLRDVFADLIGAGSAPDPGDLLRDQGHPSLPDELVAEAVVSYADTADPDVAEHLAPYVTAHSVAGTDEPSGGEPAWLDLLVTAPGGAGTDDFDDVGPAPDGFDAAGDPGPGLDFGAGAAAVPGTERESSDDDLADDGLMDIPADPVELDSDLDSDMTGDLDGDMTSEPDWADDADEEPDTEPLG